MKQTHRPDIFTFSAFDPDRNLDFNGWFLVRDGGNILVDPVPMSAHDLAHVRELGGASAIVITNSDHVRDAAALGVELGARIAGPVAERDAFSLQCDDWLGDGDSKWPGIEIVALHGSKTPGELALIVDGDTLITGDLIRAHRGGALNLLPAPKLSDPDAARASVSALAGRRGIDAVLVGDGWPVFRGGHACLQELAAAG